MSAAGLAATVIGVLVFVLALGVGLALVKGGSE